MPKKIAIVGSREFIDFNLIKEYIDLLPNDSIIVTGGARGVDRFAEGAAKLKGLEVQIFYPDWNKYGKRAGPIRNEQIVLASDEVVAFWDGYSKGTKSTIDFATQYHKPLKVFYSDG